MVDIVRDQCHCGYRISPMAVVLTTEAQALKRCPVLCMWQIGDPGWFIADVSGFIRVREKPLLRYLWFRFSKESESVMRGESSHHISRKRRVMDIAIGIGDAGEGYTSVDQGLEDRDPGPREGTEGDFMLLLLTGHFSMAEGNL